MQFIEKKKDQITFKNLFLLCFMHAFATCK